MASPPLSLAPKPSNGEGVSSMKIDDNVQKVSFKDKVLGGGPYRGGTKRDWLAEKLFCVENENVIP